MDHTYYILQKIKEAGDAFHNYDIGNHVELSVYKVIEEHINTGKNPAGHTAPRQKYCKSYNIDLKIGTYYILNYFKNILV